LPWIILGFGVLVRVISFGSGRALWIDEAMLALNILHAKLPALLLKPMLYYQVAPLGFLTVEKSLTGLLGDSELAFRLFPFACSLAGLWLFYRLARKSKLGKPALLIALAGFAASRGLVYYAGEVKQYASDVLISLSLLLLAFRVLEQAKTVQRQSTQSPSKSPGCRKSILWLGLAGVFAVWFAYPAFFVLLGLGLALMVILWRGNDRRGSVAILLCLLAWSASMGGYFAVGLETIRASKAHQAIWQDVWDKQMLSFMPSLLKAQAWQWLASRTMEVFKYPVGSQVQPLAALVFLLGLIGSCWPKRQAEPELRLSDPTEPRSSTSEDNRPYLWLLAAPIATTLLASNLHLYPFIGRMVLFLVPSYLLLMAAGVEFIGKAVKRPAILTALLGLTLIVPSLLAPKLYNTQSEEIKPVLQYIQSHRQPMDVGFVYYGAQPAMSYYAGRYQLPPLQGMAYDNYVNGLNRRPNKVETNRYITSTLQNAGQTHRRLWFILSHLHGNEGREYLRQINGQARLLDSFRNKGAAAYLYELPR